MSGKTKVLVTGAAGKIGRALTPELSRHYDLVLTDLKEFETPHSFILADVTDISAVRAACKGIDVVLHLAADSRASATWESLLPNNIIGVYNLFQAAHEAACWRVIFTSSGHAASGYQSWSHKNQNLPMPQASLYGATKIWGEALAEYYAAHKNLSCICLRLGYVQARNSQIIQPAELALDQILTFEDLLRLVIASIEAPADLRYGIFYGISDNYWKKFDIQEALEILGYKPQDDAFALAGSTWLDKLKWFYKRRVRVWIKQISGN